MDQKTADFLLQSIIDLKNTIDQSVVNLTTPHVLLKPSLSVDGDKWCALYGKDLQNGIAGFGDTPAQAMEDFDRNFYLTQVS